MKEVEIKYYDLGGNIEFLDVLDWNITLDSNGFLHSYSDEPSRIELYGAGNDKVNYYHYHGYLHRLVGPAVIYVTQYGNKKMDKFYFIYGKHYKNKQLWEIEAHRLLMLEEI